MAKSVTLTQLQTATRLYADRRESGASAFIDDTELTSLINGSLAGFYDLLVAARGHEYYQDEDTISVVSGTSRYNLPATFYELLSVTLEWTSDDHEIVLPYEQVSERHLLNNHGTWGNGNTKAYRLRAAQIEFLPEPTSAVTASLQFIPVYTTLVSGGDTFDGVNGWERLIALDVAMRMRAIEELPNADLERLFKEDKERIEELAAQRTAETPPEVADVHPEAVVPWPGYYGKVSYP